MLQTDRGTAARGGHGVMRHLTHMVLGAAVPFATLALFGVGLDRALLFSLMLAHPISMVAMVIAQRRRGRETEDAPVARTDGYDHRA